MREVNIIFVFVLYFSIDDLLNHCGEYMSNYHKFSMYLIQTAVPNTCKCSNEKKHVHHDKSLMIQFENNPSFYKSECLKWIFNNKKINYKFYKLWQIKKLVQCKCFFTTPKRCSFLKKKQQCIGTCIWSRSNVVTI